MEKRLNTAFVNAVNRCAQLVDGEILHLNPGHNRCTAAITVPRWGSTATLDFGLCLVQAVSEDITFEAYIRHTGVSLKSEWSQLLTSFRNAGVYAGETLVTGTEDDVVSKMHKIPDALLAVL